MSESPEQHSSDPTTGLTHVHSGKVRDLYRTADGLLLVVASDRISAFDHILATSIPDKGRILTAMTCWWFEQLADVVPNHLLSADDPAIHPPQLASDFDSVPIQRSTSRPSIPQCSPMPQPVFPTTPKLWASSTISSAPYRFFSSTYRGSWQRSPSIEYTPSTTIRQRRWWGSRRAGPGSARGARSVPARGRA